MGHQCHWSVPTTVVLVYLSILRSSRKGNGIATPTAVQKPTE
ncbi:hypothetical protein EGR_06250 [Echinococcus granulosus]|uniref:Uncharacterized protein n=1 Tax=Echinococcus granulosus TaxID=6210 RepID=W6UZA5_ECHGR|nr:hypothetical protein EGR_06250 [Echinococcus granulosus]EUB58934.1 hypothetical protein EGR_06250 [Echinococcus granulosus]